MEAQSSNVINFSRALYAKADRLMAAAGDLGQAGHGKRAMELAKVARQTRAKARRMDGLEPYDWSTTMSRDEMRAAGYSNQMIDDMLSLGL